MKRATFYNNNKSGDLLHIESEGCIINLRVNLENYLGQKVTNISIHVDTSEGWTLGEATTWSNNDGIGIRLVNTGKEVA